MPEPSHPSLPTLPERPGAADLLLGAALPLRALALIARVPRLRGLSLLCAAVTLAVLVAAAWLCWPLAQRVGALVGEGGWRDWLGAGLTVVTYLALLLAAALTVPSLALAPLQDPLSEACEETLGGFQSPPFSLGVAARGVGMSVAHTLFRLVLQLGGYLVLLPLNLVPVAGSVLWAVLGGAWTMWWLCAEHLSGPMARHLLPFGKVLSAMRARPLFAFGLGLGLHVLLLVPVLNALLIPVAVVGATLAFRALRARGLA